MREEKGREGHPGEVRHSEEKVGEGLLPETLREANRCAV